MSREWSNLCAAKEKSHWMELGRQVTFYLRLLQWEEIDWRQCYWETKAREVLKH